jgi:hypothetical protein
MASISSGVATPSDAARSASLLMAAQILRQEGQPIYVEKIQCFGLPVVDIAHGWTLDFEG